MKQINEKINTTVKISKLIGRSARMNS